jgi:hypothetical protein
MRPEEEMLSSGLRQAANSEVDRLWDVRNEDRLLPAIYEKEQCARRLIKAGFQHHCRPGATDSVSVRTSGSVK